MRAVKVLLVVMVLCACSSKTEGFKSNFTSVSIEDGGKVVKDGAPFTGKLVAKDREIAAVAHAVLGDSVRHVEGTDLTGLVLVLPVKDGLVEGSAAVHVDLHAEKLNPEVARRSEEALAFARAKYGSIKIAEATFVHGRLDGAATVWAPSGKAGAPMKVAEVTFRDHQLHGPAIEYWLGTTTKKRELGFESGKQVGAYRTFHENGKPESEATYVANARHGEAKAWYANGAPRETSTWDHGKPVGTHEAWYPNGQKQRVTTIAGDARDEQRWYSNGASANEPPNGVIEEFHDNGNVRQRMTYEGGEKHGAYATFYDDNAKWIVGAHERGVEHGKHQRWWKNGTLAQDSTYVAGQLDGVYKRWYANGKAWEEGRYANGKLVGPYRKWWKNGKPAQVAGYGNDGRLDGAYKTFYDTGAKWAVGTYANGKAQGVMQRWFPNGTLGYVMNHDASGRPHGAHKKWWPDGKPRLEAMYVNGRLDGDFKNWREDGTVYELATYQRGNVLQTTRSNPPRN